jgi:hypothetical protein
VGSPPPAPSAAPSAGSGPAMGCPAPWRILVAAGGRRCLASACRAGRADVASPAVGSAVGHGRRVGSPPPAPSAAPSSRQRAGHGLPSTLADLGRGRGAVAALLPACLAGRADAARPAALRGVGHGRRVGSPPPAPSAAPSSRHRAGRWLPGPCRILVATGARRCLASGLPRGSGRCCEPGRRQRRRPRSAGRLTIACAVGGSVSRHRARRSPQTGRSVPPTVAIRLG